MRFQGKTALITGGSKGIGRAVALRMAREGGAVAVNGRDVAALDEVVGQIRAAGGRAIPVAGDVSLAADVARIKDTVLGEFCGLDILVNNVGGGTMARWLDDVDESVWDRCIEVNLKSAFLVTRAFLPQMRERHSGRIVMVASIAGRNMSRISGPEYSAAKGGMLAFMRHLAVELGPFGITVNAVAPGPTLSERVVKKMAIKGEAEMARVVGAIPLGRAAKPEEVAAPILFLASDDASYITGTCIDVNGGSFMM